MARNYGIEPAIVTPVASKYGPATFDHIADRYDSTRGGEARGAASADDIEPHFSGRDLTLEVGVGTGLVAAALAARGRPVLGVDLSPAMLTYARGRLGNRLAVADAANLPFPDETFQDVYAVHVLHLIEDQLPVFREVARLLRPGGRFIVVLDGRPHKRDAVVDLIAAMNARIDPGRADRSDPDRLTERALGLGFRDAHLFEGAEVRTRTSPATLAQRMEERTTSSLWEVPEADWQEFVVPVLATLRAMGDTPIERVMRPQLLVLEWPGVG